jgi:hypothetical protein
VHASEAHPVHAPWPEYFWKEPAGQLSQTPPLAKVPASHFVQYAWPLNDCTEPVGHGMHVAWFLSVEIVCGAQSSHERSAVAFGGDTTAWPGAQTRALANGDARELVQKCSNGHVSHEPLVTLPNVPGAHATSHEVEFAALKALQSQRVHGSALVPFLNWPARQALQTEPERPGGQTVPPPSTLHSNLSPAAATKYGFCLQYEGWGVQTAAPPVA